MFPRALALLVIAIAPVMLRAQEDTLAKALWLDREFLYWWGDPPVHMHEPAGEGYADTEVAGYTDEDRRMRFFRDHRYQEIVFVDHGAVTLRIWQPGDCDALHGDTVAVLTGTWAWASDTLHVTVERTAQYPLDDVLEPYLKREPDKPIKIATLPTRVCNTGRDRLLWWEGERLSEAVRRWN